MDYDLSDFDKISLCDCTRICYGHDELRERLKQYIQTKIDQEVKKRDEEWIQALEKRNKAILS